MEHNEPWQIYSRNGEPKVGESATREEFEERKELIMGAAHLWLWRWNEGVLEVMFQKRALSKKTWPGFRDVSAAGHIDADETAVQAAVREASEEIGLTITEDDLLYCFSLRTPLAENEIDHIYLCEVPTSFQPVFDDGEVEEYDWVSLEEFEKQTTNPAEYNVLDQTQPYFAMLLGYLRSVQNATNN